MAWWLLCHKVHASRARTSKSLWWCCVNAVMEQPLRRCTTPALGKQTVWWGGVFMDSWMLNDFWYRRPYGDGYWQRLQHPKFNASSLSKVGLICRRACPCECLLTLARSPVPIAGHMILSAADRGMPLQSSWASKRSATSRWYHRGCWTSGETGKFDSPWSLCLVRFCDFLPPDTSRPHCLKVQWIEKRLEKYQTWLWRNP